MVKEKTVLVLLVLTVLAPIVLYTDRLARYTTSSPSRGGFLEDGSLSNLNGDDGKLNAFAQEFPSSIKEPVGVVYADNATGGIGPLVSSDLEAHSTGRVSAAVEQEDARGNSADHKTRVLSEADELDRSEKSSVIEQVTDKDGFDILEGELRDSDQDEGTEGDRSKEEESKEEESKEEEIERERSKEEETEGERNKEEDSKDDEIGEIGTGNQQFLNSEEQETSSDKQSQESSEEVNQQEGEKTIKKNDRMNPLPDARVRQLRDLLIRARVYLSLGSIRSNSHFSRELRMRMKDVQRVVADASKDSDLPRNAGEKQRAMEEVLSRGKQMQDDCSDIIKKLRAILHSTEEQLRVNKKQTLFLTQLAAKTLPKGLHCLPLRLSAEYYSLEPEQQQFPNKEKLEDPELFHYALFSDNVLAAAVVVNSTISNAKHPSKCVFHIVTDKLNYAAMRMWFIANSPGKATIQVQNIDDFTWLNSSYSPVLKQLRSPSMIDYYFRSHKANSDPNMKYRNPKYLSILNHLRFYLPEIFPKLNRVVFLDDDIVVQKDLTGLWRLDLDGKVNGAVETCGENFHRFDRYLNFSNPLISKNFDPHACGWAYGMNVFDLVEWRKQNITEVYHSWQKLNHDRLLWKLGTLPPGLITFYKRTFPLDRFWHVLGLGYNPDVNQRDIERAAVIHYNGNMKPWLEIGIPKYRHLWAKYLNYDQAYLRDCNINP